MTTLIRYKLTEDGRGFVVSEKWQVPERELTRSGFERTMEEVLRELRIMEGVDRDD